MNWAQRTLPVTHGELYDLLQELFGVGVYDDLTSDQPWWQARMRQITRLKTLMRKRRLNVRELAIAALWCHSHGVRAAYVEVLIRHRPKALKAWALAQRELAEAEFDTEYADAVEAATASLDFDAVSRLLRATDKEQALAHFNAHQKERP